MRNEAWEASGHVSGFHDPMVDCRKCKSRYRADQINVNESCPDCGEKDWTDIQPYAFYKDWSNGRFFKKSLFET